MTRPISDNIARFLQVVGVLRQKGEFGIDASTDMLIFKGRTGVAREAVDLASAQTIAGNKTLTGTTTLSGTTAITGATSFTGATTGVRRASVVTDADTIAVGAADSGTTYLCTKATDTQVFTLPLAATAGLYYTFVCRHASGEIHVGVGTGDNITGKTHGAENGTALTSTATTGLLKNTAANNVIGDFCTLQSDGVTTWHMTSVAGVWSVT